MSPLWPASSRRDSRGFRRRAAAGRVGLGRFRRSRARDRARAIAAVVAIVTALALGGPEPASADAARPSLLFKAPAPRDAQRWREQIARKLGPLAVSDPAARFALSAPSLSATRLLALHRIEELLANARAQTAALVEDQALSDLAEAARIGEQLGDVPGASAWNAEIQLDLGVTAAQAGLSELAEGAFRVAATLDRSRRLLDAEAPPAVVALFQRVAREVALGPVGQLEVTATAGGARVYLDDSLQGLAPARLRTTVGRHVLRVEAPGHRVYGAFIDVLEGQRPTLTVALAPDLALERAQALERAAERGDFAGVAGALRALPQASGGAGSIYVLEVEGAGNKALLFRCDADGCRMPLRLSSLELAQSELLAPAAPFDARRLALERAWLAQGPRSISEADARPAAPWWRRWYVWGGVLALATAGTALAVALSADRQPAQRLRVVIQPGGVGQ